ncbi:TPA: ShlB/FhaC/HecB family hemolysin secretion/activation protein [Klebsiella quasipneumoniae subsp. similipneumoniae]|nr:ShlB/FhaC/HecB family hemolysin secretion/activation protein [Klebsiella quasipneumoniae subsp. similipneumoniae]
MKRTGLYFGTIILMLPLDSSALLPNSGTLSNLNENNKKQHIQHQKNNFDQIKSNDTYNQSKNDINLQNNTITLKNLSLDYFHSNDEKLNEKELRELLNPYIGKKITFNELSHISKLVEGEIKRKGILLVNAIIPPQNFSSGEIRLNVIQARFDSAVLQNTTSVSDSILTGIINNYLTHNEVIKSDKFERLAYLLNELSGIHATITLIPGSKAGTSSIFIDAVKEKDLFFIQSDNYGNDVIGKQRLQVGGYINSPSGIGDRLSLSIHGTYQKGEFTGEVIDYNFPINYSGARGWLKNSRIDYKYNFMNSLFQGYSNSFSYGVDVPFVRNNQWQTDYSISAEHSKMVDNYSGIFSYAGKKGRKQRDMINGTIKGNLNLDERGIFYFYLGSCLSRVTYKDKASEFWNGSDLRNTHEPKITHIYDIQYNYPLPNTMLIKARVNGLLTNGNLDSSQKLMLGGPNGVRGFDGDKHLVDYGYIVNTEISKVYHENIFESDIKATIFHDYGLGYINKNNILKGGQKINDNNIQKLSSLGFGLSFSATKIGVFDIQWAYPLSIYNKEQGYNPENKLWISFSSFF